MEQEGDGSLSGNEIVDLAFREFGEWVRSRPDDVQELDAIEQAELYAASQAA